MVRSGEATQAHDLDRTLELLLQHKQHGYVGLNYTAQGDGEGNLKVTITFPSPSEVAKLEAMEEMGPQGATPAAVPLEAPEALAPAASSNVVVRVSMGEDLEKRLAEKYPKGFLEAAKSTREVQK
jgi:hypothetical protein